MSRVLIAGAGSWGTALATTLAKKHSVFLWARKIKTAEEINSKNTNNKYFHKKALNKKIKSFSGPIQSNQFDFIFYVLPAKYFSEFCYKYLINQKINNFVICSKGIDKSGLLLSNISKKLLTYSGLYVLSGPSFANEVFDQKPTAVSIAGNKKMIDLGKLFISTNIRVYYSNNLQSLELLGILKNIYAIGAGIIEGLGFGENARASYISRCINEISYMLKINNFDPKNILTLGGIGDLILTCSSKKSRNYFYGYNLIKKKETKSIQKTLEGLNSINCIKKNFIISLKYLPILKTIINIIKGKDPNKEIELLLTRKFKYE